MPARFSRACGAAKSGRAPTAKVLGEDLKGAEMRAAFEGLGKDARREVESVLEGAFREPDVVARLTAEVLNSVR